MTASLATCRGGRAGEEEETSLRTGGENRPTSELKVRGIRRSSGGTCLRLEGPHLLRDLGVVLQRVARPVPQQLGDLLHLRPDLVPFLLDRQHALHTHGRQQALQDHVHVLRQLGTVARPAGRLDVQQLLLHLELALLALQEGGPLALDDREEEGGAVLGTLLELRLGALAALLNLGLEL